MSDITIKITCGFSGETIEFKFDENSTIKELKETYAEKYAIEIEGELNAKKIEKAVLRAEYDFKFVLDTEILDDNRKLNEVFKGDELKGEVPIYAIRRSQEITDCLKDINKLTLTGSSIKKLSLTFSPLEKCTTREEILEKKIGFDIKKDTPILASSDKDIVLAVVQKDGMALQYASEDLRKDRDVVLAAVTQNGLAFRQASIELKADREIFLAAMQQNGLALRYAPDHFKAVKDIVLAAVQQNGEALKFATDDLRKDREIVLAAV
jgi:hypothetical protein